MMMGLRRRPSRTGIHLRTRVRSEESRSGLSLFLLPEGTGMRLSLEQGRIAEHCLWRIWMPGGVERVWESCVGCLECRGAVGMVGRWRCRVSLFGLLVAAVTRG